jgi:hypothetical protein
MWRRLCERPAQAREAEQIQDAFSVACLHLDALVVDQRL